MAGFTPELTLYLASSKLSKNTLSGQRNPHICKRNDPLMLCTSIEVNGALLPQPR